jgi:DNA-binding transcriptional ArsR family regulator
MSASLALSVPTVTKALESLERTGIVREITRRQRGRLFVYDAYLALLNRGTEATAVPPRATG